MQLYSLTVSGLRCFRNPVALTDLDPGINIIYGPNEMGKSTLIWGLVLAFCNRHDVGGEGILAYRPWGTSLSPLIEVEFTAGGKRYRLKKGFLGQAQCTLAEWERGNYLALAEGKDADDRVREFMWARFPGRGLARGSDWGLAHLLWMPQDEKRFISPSVSSQVEDYFRQAAGATIFTPRDDKLLQLISEHYGAIYTPKKGDYQKGAAVRQARVRRQELEAKLAHARQQLAEISNRALRLRELQEEAATIKKTIAEQTADYNQLVLQMEKVKEIKGQMETATAKAEAAEQQWTSLHNILGQVNSWAQRGAEAAIKKEEKGRELIGVQRRLERQEQLVKAKKEEAKRATIDLKETNRRLNRSYKIRELLALNKEIKQLTEDYKAVGQIQQKITRLQQDLERWPVPTGKELAAVQELEKKIEIGRGQAKAQGLRIEFEPIKDLTVTVQTEDERAEHSVGPGRPLVMDLTAAEAQLEISTAGRLNIISGAKELKRILAQLKTDGKKLAASLKTYRVGTGEELQERYRWGQDRQGEIEHLKLQEKNRLGQSESSYHLQDLLSEKRQLLEAQCRQLQVNEAELEAITISDSVELERRARDLEQKQEAAEKEQGELQRQEKKIKIRCRQLEQELTRHEQMVKTAASEKEALLIPYRGEKTQLERRLQETRQEKLEHQELLKRLESKLPPAAAAMERKIFRLKQDLEHRKKQLAELQEEIAELRAQVNLQSESGFYSQINQLEEEYELVKKEHESLELKARAVKLLYRLAQARHEAMLADLTEPIRQGLNDLFRQVTAKSERKLQLEADLSLAGLQIEHEDSLQPLDVFSIGTQEQMLLLARLSLAYFLSGEERQLVVLDDALVNSDSRRRRRILALLEKAAVDRFQLLILTCHPEMYQELPGKRYELASLV